MKARLAIILCLALAPVAIIAQASTPVTPPPAPPPAPLQAKDTKTFSDFELSLEKAKNMQLKIESVVDQANKQIAKMNDQRDQLMKDVNVKMNAVKAENGWKEDEVGWDDNQSKFVKIPAKPAAAPAAAPAAKK